MVIAYDQIARIEGALRCVPRRSWSQIARDVGVSRATVESVAKGTRKNLRKPPEVAGECPPHRCGGCGRLITTEECIACAAEAA